MLKIVLQLIFISSLHNAKSARILAVFPTPSVSPQQLFRTLLQELAERGHEITLVTANSAFANDQISENISGVNIYNKTSRIWQKYINVIISDQSRDVVSEMSLTLHTIRSIFKELLQSAEINSLIKEKHSYFDLLLLEASVTPLISLSHVFNAPVILVSSMGAVLGNYEIVGAPSQPFLYPSVYRHRVYNLTSWEKVTEMYTYIRLELKLRTSEKKVDLMLKEHFGSDFPSLNELKGNVYALFLNDDPLWAGYRPVSPNVVFMGGLQPKNIEQLPQDLQTFLDKSINGVVYVSFGSNIKPSLLPPNKLLRILNVLSEIPYDVLVKWDNDNRLPRVSKHIKIYNWLPQSAVLGHKKIKLFITQGGVQSTFEAINASVPLIGLPMYSDQWYNTEKYIKFHIGLQLDLASLTEEKLKDSIDMVIRDESYRISITELRDVMFGYPGSSMERAIWWTEQVMLPYGVRHLRAPASNMTWTAYLELDFIFSILLILYILILVFIIFMALIFLYIFKSFKKIKKKMT